MPKRIAMTTLNARTIDILNVIRQNASLEYQNLVPEVETTKDIPKVGDVLFGYPALANQFLSALVNRIAMVRVKSAVFNNAYAELKKGYLEFGETVEEVFVSIAKAREFSAEKAADRELKRSLPDVRSAFHAMNWRVQYPVTIQDQDLRQAFLSINGVQDLIARIVDSIYTGAEYDEYLLFKYLIIKAIAKGKMYPVPVDMSTIKNSAVSFRAMSNQLTFMSNKYNSAGVTTTTPKADQFIFMDSTFNAQYDVDVLASAFNMNKADFAGRLMLIDSFTSFDNDRFDVIRANSDMIDEVTPEELELMADVKAVIVDREWFQVYDNNTVFTEKFVAAGAYWNYFFNVWKTVSSSPFSNAVVFIDEKANVQPLTAITFTVASKIVNENGTILTLAESGENSLAPTDLNFIQNESATKGGVAVHKYGAFIFPDGATGFVPTAEYAGNYYVAGTAISPATAQGATVTMTLTTRMASFRFVPDDPNLNEQVPGGEQPGVENTTKSVTKL